MQGDRVNSLNGSEHLTYHGLVIPQQCNDVLLVRDIQSHRVTVGKVIADHTVFIHACDLHDPRLVGVVEQLQNGVAFAVVRDHRMHLCQGVQVSRPGCKELFDAAGRLTRIDHLLLIQLGDRGAFGFLVQAFEYDNARSGNADCQGDEYRFTAGFQLAGRGSMGTRTDGEYDTDVTP